MNRTPAVLFALAALLAATTAQAAGPSRVDICHIANAGFALHGPEGTVLVDALFRDGLPDYQHASEALNEKMEAGLVPFDDVRFVIVSHAHADHFNAEALVRHTTRNPDTRYIVTPQTRDRMAAAGLREEPASRVNAVYPDNDKKEHFRHSGAHVTVFRISHGKGVPAQNIGTLIEIGGIRAFHTGDMSPVPEELAAAGLTGLGVDVLMVPFWLLMDDDSRALTRRTFSAKTVIPMHVPDKEQDWMAEYGGLAGLRKLIEANVPDARWLTGEMACESFEKPQ